MEPVGGSLRLLPSCMTRNCTQTSIWANRSVAYQSDLKVAVSELLFPETFENLPAYKWNWASYLRYSLQPIKPNVMAANVMALKERGKVIAVAIRYGDPAYSDPLTQEMQVATVVRVFSLENRFTCETSSIKLTKHPSLTDCPFEFIVQDSLTLELRNQFEASKAQGFVFNMASP